MNTETYYEENVVSEVMEKCKNCHYEYFYSYGHTMINYGALFFIDRSYNDSEEKTKYILKRIKLYNFLYKYLRFLNPLLERL